MKRNTALTCLVSLLTLGFGAGIAQALAATPSFTISASNITMPSSGTGYIPYTLTSVNGFAGTVEVSCTAPNTPVGVRVPYVSEGGPLAPGNVLTANATAKGFIVLLASPPAIVPVRLNLPGPGGGSGWTLAGALMLGFGLRKRKERRSTRLLLAAGMLIGPMGMGACGISPKTLTPGTYTYTLNANGYDQNNTSISASTTVNVTVPPGIVFQ